MHTHTDFVDKCPLGRWRKSSKSIKIALVFEDTLYLEV
jgi:hypothetical protein